MTKRASIATPAVWRQAKKAVEANLLTEDVRNEIASDFWQGFHNIGWAQMTEDERVEAVAVYLHAQEKAAKAAQEKAALEAKRLAAQPAAPADKSLLLVTRGFMSKCF